MNRLDLAAEVERRDLSLAELAKASGLSYGTVHRIASGAPGRPVTRRKLRQALTEFPPVEVVAVESPSPTEPEPVAVQPQRRSGAELLAEVKATARDPWAREAS